MPHLIVFKICATREREILILIQTEYHVSVMARTAIIQICLFEYLYKRMILFVIIGIMRDLVTNSTVL